MSTDDHDAYFAAAAIFQNEADYLAEWLAFHEAEGVQHFYLYDNASTDDFLYVVRPWIDRGVVTLMSWNEAFDDGAQMHAYSDCLARAQHFRWIAFIDIDEFLFSPTGEAVRDILTRFEGEAGIVVNWQVYGSSRLDSRPPGLVIENFVWRAREAWKRNERVKSIVDPTKAIRPTGPHFFIYQPGKLAVDETGAPTRIVHQTRRRRIISRLMAWLRLPADPYSVRVSSRSGVRVDLLRINHYVTKSREESRAKFKDRAMTERAKEDYFRYHDRNEVFDAVLAPRAAVVRAKIDAA